MQFVVQLLEFYSWKIIIVGVIQFDKHGVTDKRTNGRTDKHILDDKGRRIACVDRLV